MGKTADNIVPGVACFLGQYEYTVDAQRRLAIPSSWRGPGEASHFVLLPGRETSLQLVPASTLQELIVKLQKVSFADAQAAVALASIGSMAADCRPEPRQGRIVLPPSLMEHAGITDRAILLGAVTTIQIWAPENWKRRRMDSNRGLDVIQALQERPDDLTDILRKAIRPRK